MSRSYRLLILALGLILDGPAHAYAESNGKQPDAQQSIANSLNNISSRYDEAANRAKGTEKQEAPCGEHSYNSNAELCAQWKAADAAADSAWWAWASGLVGFGSLIGVIFALLLALHSNWIARDTARRQLRAYISVKKVFCSRFEIGLPLEFEIEFINTGQTPAIDFGTVYMVGFRLNNSQKEFEEALESDVISRSTCGANIAHGIQFKDNEPLSIIVSSHCVNDDGAIYAWGACFYKDIFGARHKLQFRFAMGGKYGPPGVRDLAACEIGNAST